MTDKKKKKERVQHKARLQRFIYYFFPFIKKKKKSSGKCVMCTKKAQEYDNTKIKKSYLQSNAAFKMHENVD